MKTSIIIPSRNENPLNLARTVHSIYENATGEYEILIGYDGEPFPEIPLPDNTKVIKFPNTVGIKTNINALAAMATGKYLYKSDAHCAFGKGFDQILQADMQDDWIVMPRFYVLNGETWQWQDERFYDYFYLSCPFTDPRGFRFKAGGHWPERTAERLSIPIDETPQIHGSGWFMAKDRFFELGGFPNIDPYGHAQEPIWLALKNQLTGGKCMVNKKTWYAHLHQQGNKRGYQMDRAQEEKSYSLAAHTFMKDPRILGWLEKNMPMPTWPENWRHTLDLYQKGVLWPHR
jgi:cellulose synthase/poly-beta-1,6-N-acetylglucosamine synthase-like glycosyltransferase